MENEGDKLIILKDIFIYTSISGKSCLKISPKWTGWRNGDLTSH